MAWVYLDDNFPDHPKVVAAGGDAAWLFVCGLAYIKRHGTEGTIPKGQVPKLSDRRSPMRLAGQLVKVGLWHDHGEHYAVNDYHEWNRSQEARSQAGRKAARARWARNANRNANASETHSGRSAIASETHMPQHAQSPPLPTRTSDDKSNRAVGASERTANPPDELPDPERNLGAIAAIRKQHPLATNRKDEP